MKQIASNYAYSPATNVVTLTGVNIDADQLLLIVAPGVGRTLYNFASVTGTVVAGADTRVTLNASTAGLTTTSPLVIFYDDQASAQAVTGTVALDPASLVALENITVTVGSSVALAAGSEQIGSVTASISNFPATQTVAGTVTANVAGNLNGTIENYDTDGTATHKVAVQIYDPNGQALGGGAPLPISGTVTANLGNQLVAPNSFSISGEDASGFLPSYGVQVGFVDNANDFRVVKTSQPLPISGTVTANVSQDSNGLRYLVDEGTSVQIAAGLSYITDITDPGAGHIVSEANPLPISGTVTANNPSGALTTRFGSVTTANTAQITSAVTNTNRKYLLAQNISAGTVTIGIGFSPTTTQGIQLTAGAGLTFDSFCPTGAVFWLGAVTGAAFTILEG